jgi:glycerol-3-phosphate dehydrogenase
MAHVQRNLSELASRDYDLVIVGGGIFGAAAAWDATLRGLSVALLERADFAHAASANCFKMIHGGIRYLQHADLIRLRQSVAERSAFLRIAPHLARPLPILIPTYGHGMKGKEILAAGMKLYDLLTADRNRGIADPSRRIPATRTLSARQVAELYPALDVPGFTGGAVFHDGQMHSPARLLLAFLLSASARGARMANYAEATSLLRSGDRITGVRVRDTLEGGEYEVRGRVVLNAAGGLAPQWLARSLGQALSPVPTFSRDACFVVRRTLPGPYALAVSGGSRDPDAIFSRDARHLFLVPWRDCTLVGVWHRVWKEDPDRVAVSDAELQAWLEEINAACPWLELRREEVALTQCGLVLFGENRPGAQDLSYGKRSLLVDHRRTDAVDGLLTLIGVRYTTARAEADRAVRLVFQQLGRSAPRSRTAWTPLWGGEIDSFEALEREARAARPEGVSDASLSALLQNHGSGYRQVLECAKDDATLVLTLPGSGTLRAEVVHAVRGEMAVRLEDVVFRRTDLGTSGHPGAAGLEACAGLMAAELGWSPARTSEELARTLAAFPSAPAAPHRAGRIAPGH